MDYFARFTLDRKSTSMSIWLFPISCQLDSSPSVRSAPLNAGSPFSQDSYCEILYLEIVFTKFRWWTAPCWKNFRGVIMNSRPAPWKHRLIWKGDLIIVTRLSNRQLIEMKLLNRTNGIGFRTISILHPNDKKIIKIETERPDWLTWDNKLFNFQ